MYTEYHCSFCGESFNRSACCEEHEKHCCSRKRVPYSTFTTDIYYDSVTGNIYDVFDTETGCCYQDRENSDTFYDSAGTLEFPMGYCDVDPADLLVSATVRHLKDDAAGFSESDIYRDLKQQALERLVKIKKAIDNYLNLQGR